MRAIPHGHMVRFWEIRHLRFHVQTNKIGHSWTRYKVMMNEETSQLSDADLTILTDGGDARFGGYVSATRDGKWKFVSVYSS